MLHWVTERIKLAKHEKCLLHVMGVFFLKVWDCLGLQKMKVTEVTRILDLEGMSRTPNAKACGGLGKRRDPVSFLSPLCIVTSCCLRRRGLSLDFSASCRAKQWASGIHKPLKQCALFCVRGAIWCIQGFHILKRKIKNFLDPVIL